MFFLSCLYQLKGLQLVSKKLIMLSLQETDLFYTAVFGKQFQTPVLVNDKYSKCTDLGYSVVHFYIHGAYMLKNDCCCLGHVAAVA